MTYDQEEFDIRCEWGGQGVQHLAPISEVVIIVDVLSFTTCVTIACAHRATVFPFRWNDDSAISFARSKNAELAEQRGKGHYSLSPGSFVKASVGTRLVLPSPNGSTLSLSTGSITTLAGCLRNAKAVAHAAMRYERTIAVIPAGERWQTDGSLRPSVEDLLGAGAIIRHLKGSLSPEARSAVSAFNGARDNLLGYLKESSSGKELTAKGFGEDVDLGAELDTDVCVPVLTDGAYVAG